MRNDAIATKHVFAGNNRVASVVHPGGAEAVTSAPASDGFFSDGKPGNDRAKDALRNPAFGGLELTRFPSYSAQFPTPIGH